MIEVKNLVRTFKSVDHTIKPVNDVSFGLEQGTLASILGKSGSGKSTLLSLLGPLDKPTSDDVLVNGVSLAGMPEGKLTQFRRRDIGFVFQQLNLIPNLSAVDNVMLLTIEFAGVRKAAQLQRARKLLEQVQLDPEEHVRRINRLSGGEQQHVAIARALANEHTLILADEPTGNLDEQTGQHIIELLSSLSRDHNKPSSSSPTTGPWPIEPTVGSVSNRQADRGNSPGDGELARVAPAPLGGTSRG